MKCDTCRHLQAEVCNAKTIFSDFSCYEAKEPIGSDRARWVCEYCFRTIYINSLPADWEFVWQSAVCPECRKRVKHDGGYFVVKGGAYATGPDPRAPKQDAVAAPVAESDDVKWAEKILYNVKLFPGEKHEPHIVVWWLDEFIRRFRAKEAELAAYKKESGEWGATIAAQQSEIMKLKAELATAKADIERLAKSQPNSVPIPRIPYCFSGNACETGLSCPTCQCLESCRRIRDYWLGEVKRAKALPAPAPDAEIERLKAASIHVTATDFHRPDPDSIDQLLTNMRHTARVADRMSAEGVTIYADRLEKLKAQQPGPAIGNPPPRYSDIPSCFTAVLAGALQKCRTCPIYGSCVKLRDYWRKQVNEAVADAQPAHADDLRERLAALTHERWGRWMRYVFLKGTQDEGGETVISYRDTDCWMRQMKTPYADLPENEKDSDREEADRMLALLPKATPAADVEIERLGRLLLELARWFEDKRELKTAKDLRSIAALLRSIHKPVPSDDAEIGLWRVTVEGLAKWCEKHGSFHELESDTQTNLCIIATILRSINKPADDAEIERLAHCCDIRASMLALQNPKGAMDLRAAAALLRSRKGHKIEWWREGNRVCAKTDQMQISMMGGTGNCPETAALNQAVGLLVRFYPHYLGITVTERGNVLE